MLYFYTTTFIIQPKRMKHNKDKAYAADEHFYKSPQWFFDNVSRYDNYDRTMPKIFVGEYAAHTDADVPKRENNWLAALSEAAFLIGVERNSDHVVMTCYAPLFGRINHQQWQPNLIWFDNEKCYATPSYYVQKAFSSNIGDYIAETQCDDKQLHISASVTEDGSKLFIKIVNVSGEDKNITLNIDRDSMNCEVYELYGKIDTINSESGFCREYRQGEIGEDFTIRKHSVTVFCFEQ